MEEDFSPLDYGSTGGGAFDQFQAPQPAAPLPMTYPDVKRLQALIQIQSKVQFDIYNRRLDPETGRSVLEQIGRQMAPLVQRQAAGQAAAKKQAMDDLLQQDAFTQAILQANAKNDAEHFNDRVAVHIGPMGEEERFYMESPGVWKPMGFAAAKEDAMFAPVSGGPGADPVGELSEMEPMGTGGQTFGMQHKPAPSGHTMEIWNGSRGQRVGFSPDGSGMRATSYEGMDPATGQWRPQEGRAVMRPVRNEDGTVSMVKTWEPTPPPAQEQQQQGPIDPQTMQIFKALAANGVAHLPPGIQRNAAQGRLLQTFVQRHLQSQYAQQQRAADQARIDRRTQAKAQETKQADDEKERRKVFDKAFDKEMSALERELGRWRADNKDKKGHPPAYLADRDAMKEEAKQRASADVYSRYPKLFPSQSEDQVSPQKTPAASGGRKGAEKPAAPAKPEPLPKTKFSDAEIEVEIERRRREKDTKAASHPILSPPYGFSH